MSGEGERKQRIAEVYSRAAETYAHIAYFRQHAQRLVALAGLTAGERVLDIACGRGAVLFEATQRVGTTGSVIGVDIAADMVRKTAADIESRRIANARALVMDAEALEFADAEFDRAVCAFSLQFFPDLARALCEFRRVLKPDGSVGVSTWGDDDPEWDWFDDMIAEYGSPPSLRAQKLDDPARVAQALEGVGFADVRSVVEESDIVYADEAEWWNVRWSISSRAALDQLSPSELQRLERDASQRLGTMRQVDGYHEKQVVIYTLARNPRG